MESIAELLLGGTGLDLWGFILLCGVSFIGSFTTAALGLGGGILVLATMTLFFPPAVLIPIHGVVQLGSNVGRAALMFRNVFREILPVFLIGTILGAVLGANLVVALPIALLQLVLALFILYSTWAPKFQASEPGKLTFFGVGAVGAFVTMFVGATGPLIMPFASAACKERQAVVATHATLMSNSAFTQTDCLRPSRLCVCAIYPVTRRLDRLWIYWNIHRQTRAQPSSGACVSHRNEGDRYCNRISPSFRRHKRCNVVTVCSNRSPFRQSNILHSQHELIDHMVEIAHSLH